MCVDILFEPAPPTNDEAWWLESLEEEVARKGFRDVLGTPDGRRLRDIAAAHAAGLGRAIFAIDTDRLHLNWAHGGDVRVRVPQPVTAMILAVMLYTGTRLQGAFRRETMARVPGWRFLYTCLALFNRHMLDRTHLRKETPRSERPALKKIPAPLSMKEDFFVYHGLHNVSIRDLEPFIARSKQWRGDERTLHLSFSTFVSLSASRAISLEFAAGEGGAASETADQGLLIEAKVEPDYRDTLPMFADVSWISKFPIEEELLLSPFCVFTLSQKGHEESFDAETYAELLTQAEAATRYESYITSSGRKVRIQVLRLVLMPTYMG
jgi:hypothetical protein